ncbi:MAG: hypothetical protein ACRDJ4_10105 [Actinomycetota bacterium]
MAIEITAVVIASLTSMVAADAERWVLPSDVVGEGRVVNRDG